MVFEILFSQSSFVVMHIMSNSQAQGKAMNVTHFPLNHVIVKTTTKFLAVNTGIKQSISQ